MAGSGYGDCVTGGWSEAAGVAAGVPVPFGRWRLVGGIRALGSIRGYGFERDPPGYGASADRGHGRGHSDPDRRLWRPG
jgi:hypothetical protein